METLMKSFKAEYRINKKKSFNNIINIKEKVSVPISAKTGPNF